jgi:DNA-binding HxlR family transcriptional regulator
MPARIDAPHPARRSVGNAFMRVCPSRTVLDVLADKWSALLICALADGTLRFGELRRHVEGITQKMLSQTLRALEREGMVRRTVIPTTPPQVEYALTPMGEEVLALLESLRGWAERNMHRVVAARSAYEARQLRPEHSGRRTVRTV